MAELNKVQKEQARQAYLRTPIGRQEQAYKDYLINPANSGIGAPLRSLFAGEGPEAAGTQINVPSYDGGMGAGGRYNTIMGLQESGLPPEMLKGIMDRTIGSDDLNVMVEGLVQDDPGIFNSGGSLVSGSGIQFSPAGSDSEILKGLALEKRKLDDLNKAREAEVFDFPSGPKGASLDKKAMLEKQSEELAKRELLGEEATFQPSPLDEIGALIAEAQIKTSKTDVKKEVEDLVPTFSGSGRGEINEKPGDRADYMASLSSGEKDKVIEDSFAAAMSDYNEAAGKAPPKEKESKEDSLARYKKEFEEATGIDASGKVDKSRALMAFGLALMKNKGGNLFEELGIAGEKAMPYIDKARSDARAAQLASGNYALGQQKADVAADRAALQATAGFKSDMYLKWYDSQLKREENRLKSLADLKQAKIEGGGSDYTKTKDFTFASGAGDATAWKIPVVYDTKTPSGGVILKPDAFARKYIDGRAGVEDALDVIGQMRQASTEIAAGGGTSKFAFDKINSIAKAVFPNLNTGQPSSEQEYAQGVNLLMGRFKRFLTQETGNGISNIDVQIWTKEIMKKPSWFTNADETASALGQLEDIFYAKITEFDQGLEFIYNTDNLLPGDFERMTKTYGTLDQIQGSTGNLILKDGKIVRSK